MLFKNFVLLCEKEMAIIGRKAHYFQGFLPTVKDKFLTSAKIGYHFEFCFGQTTQELVSMCPKFEVKSFRGWDFNKGW